MYSPTQLMTLAGYGDCPPDVVPSRLLSDYDLYQMGLSPRTVRAMEDELAEMGLGLGISIKGIARGIGKGFKKVGKAVAKGAVKVGRVAVRAAPILLPAAGAGFLAVKFGPKLVSRAAKLFKKPPSQLTEAEVQQAGVTPEVPIARPSVVDIDAAPILRAAEDRKSVGQLECEARGGVWTRSGCRLPNGKGEPKRAPSLLDRLKAIVERAAPLVPQAVEAFAPAPPPAAAPPTYFPPAGGGAPPPGAGLTEAGMQPPAPAGMPGWILPAAGIAFMMMMQGRRGAR